MPRLASLTLQQLAGIGITRGTQGSWDFTYTIDNPNAYNTPASDQFGTCAAMSGNYAVVGAPYEDHASGSSSGQVYIFNVSTGALLYTLNNPTAYSTAAGDQFGFDVAIDGNWLVVGAPYEDQAGNTSSGKVYIYDISGFSGSTISSADYILNNPNAYSTPYNDRFGSAVAISGNYIAVGASVEDDAGGTDSGKVYVYNKNTFTTSTISSANYVLDNPNAYSTSAGDNFGTGVAIDGDWLVVGAYNEDDAGGTSSGKVYIYDISDFSGSTISSADYTIDNPNVYGTSASDQFGGKAIGISGDYIVIGARSEDEPSQTNPGKAYIYDKSTFTTNTITSANYTLDSPSPQNDYFGTSVSIDGNFVVVSSPYATMTYTQSGYVYIYDISTFTTSTISSANYTLENPNAYGTAQSDNFGTSVSISGNNAIATAPYEDESGGSSSGKAYLFEFT